MQHRVVYNLQDFESSHQLKSIATSTSLKHCRHIELPPPTASAHSLRFDGLAAFAGSATLCPCFSVLASGSQLAPTVPESNCWCAPFGDGSYHIANLSIYAHLIFNHSVLCRLCPGCILVRWVSVGLITLFSLLIVLFSLALSLSIAVCHLKWFAFNSEIQLLINVRWFVLGVSASLLHPCTALMASPRSRWLRHIRSSLLFCYFHLCRLLF